MKAVPEFFFALRDDLQFHCDEFNKTVTEEVNKITPQHFLPTRADPESTGYDVRCAAPDGVILTPECYIKMPLGFRMFAPKGWWLQLAPRSSAFLKSHIHALYGVIDETFENEMIFAGQYIPDACQLLNVNFKKVIKFGERIAQLMPVERQDMNCRIVTNSEYTALTMARNGARGTGGFGSTGKI